MLKFLSGKPYEPLREAPIKELTYKTVFLLALASAGRRSELHALLFDDKHFLLDKEQRKATLFFAPGFLSKTQRVGETNSPLIIPALPTGKELPVAPNCPVRDLKYYHRRTSEPSVRKGRKKLFIPIKDNHQGMEISTSII